MIKYICDCCGKEMTEGQHEDGFFSFSDSSMIALCPVCSEKAQKIKDEIHAKLKQLKSERTQKLFSMIRKGEL